MVEVKISLNLKMLRKHIPVWLVIGFDRTLV